MFRMEKCVDVCVVCIEYKQPRTHREVECCLLSFFNNILFSASLGGLTVFIWVFITVFFHSQITSESLWCFHCLPISGEQTCLRVKGIPSTQRDVFIFSHSLFHYMEKNSSTEG